MWLLFFLPYWLVFANTVNPEPQNAGLVGAARTAEVHVGFVKLNPRGWWPTYGIQET